MKKAIALVVALMFVFAITTVCFAVEKKDAAATAASTDKKDADKKDTADKKTTKKKGKKVEKKSEEKKDDKKEAAPSPTPADKKAPAKKKSAGY